MDITELRRIGHEELEVYSTIDPSFEVKTIYEVTQENNGIGGLRFVEVDVTPYIKNYDRIQGNSPIEWISSLDLEQAVMFLVRISNRVAGGALLITDRQNNFNLTASLWDIRVSPESRRRGIGRSVISHILEYSRSLDCKMVKVETQNTNVNACKFYADSGFYLGTIERFSYSQPELINEYRLLWYRDLL